MTITPTAPRGTVVTGVLYVDDFSEFAETGDELRAMPYSYTKGPANIDSILSIMSGCAP